MKHLLSIIGLLLLVSTANAQIVAKVYEAPETESLVKEHQKIAILPMNVTMRDNKPSKKNRMSPEDLERMENDYQESFQNSMYSWFLRMKKKGRMTQEIQDVTRTNALLRKNGLESMDDIKMYTYDEIAEMLGVDAVFAGDVMATRSFGKGGAVAIAALTGVRVKTGDADVMVKLYNGKDGKLLWSFDRTVASNAANEPEDVVNYLMKRVSKRFPYKS